VRDEKFSLDSFFNTIKDISSGLKPDFFSKQINSQQEKDKAYTTTQEESDAQSLQQRGKNSGNQERNLKDSSKSDKGNDEEH